MIGAVIRLTFQTLYAAARLAGILAFLLTRALIGLVQALWRLWMNRRRAVAPPAIWTQLPSIAPIAPPPKPLLPPRDGPPVAKMRPRPHMVPRYNSGARHVRRWF